MFKCNMIHDFKKIGFILCEKVFRHGFQVCQKKYLKFSGNMQGLLIIIRSSSFAPFKFR